MDGYWGAPTATADFCEPNYARTRYIAEFLNALSSMPIALLGVVGLYHCAEQRLGAEQFSCYALIGIIGIGSVAFHTTLLRGPQVLDELPMLWVIVSFWYALAQSHAHRTGKRFPLAARAVLLGYASASSVVYFLYGFEPFLVSYAGSIVVLVVMCVRTALFGALRSTDQARRLLLGAVFVYVGGFALLWVPGELFCASVPLPLADKLHALFHLTSTAGPQMLLTGLALSKHHGERIAAVPHWRFGGLPAVVRGDKAV